MKVLFLALTFLFSKPTFANCNMLKDGSCYNDDTIAVGEPDPNGSGRVPHGRLPNIGELPHPQLPLLHFKKKRKPPSGFHPVHAGGLVRGFVEVGNDPAVKDPVPPDNGNPPDGLGTQ